MLIWHAVESKAKFGFVKAQMVRQIEYNSISIKNKFMKRCFLFLSVLFCLGTHAQTNDVENGLIIIAQYEQYYKANAMDAMSFKNSLDRAKSKVESNSFTADEQELLKSAYDAYMIANTVEGKLYNGVMESTIQGDIPGWEGTGSRFYDANNEGHFWGSSDNALDGFSGNIAEEWIHADILTKELQRLPNANIYQTIKGLPAGEYVVSAWCLACWQLDDSKTIEGVSLYANSESVSVSTKDHNPQHYSLHVTISEGEDLTVGFKNEGSLANWIAIDNVTLYCFDKTIIANLVDRTNIGVCGDNATWTFDETTGTLTISGNGDMYDYWSDLAPWGVFHNYLKKVVVGEGITRLGARAFHLFHYPLLTEVILPESLLHIGSYAFCNNCPNLQQINYPSNLKAIEDYAFHGCGRISTPIFPEGLESIGDRTYDNMHFGDVVLPNSLLFVHGNAFKGTVMNSLSFAGVQSNLVLRDGTIYNKEGSILYTCLNKESANFIVPDGVEKINDFAFEECSSFTSIELPSSLSMIGAHAFYNCTSLTTFIAHGSTPAELTYDGAYGYSTFQDFDLNKSTLIVPRGSKSIYESTEGWNQFGRIIEQGYELPSELMEYYSANAYGAESFLDAINAANGKIDNGTFTDESKNILMTAFQNYLAANEVKGIVINPTMEGVSDNDNLLLGWEGTGVRSSNTDNPGRFWSWTEEFNPGISGTFAEQWINDEEICDADMYQTISGLPAGTYVLSAYCIACRKDDDTLPVHGVTLYANDQSTVVSTRNNSPIQYRVVVTIEGDENLTIGYKVSNTNAHWAAIDNVQLYCLDKTAASEITPKEPSGKCGENVTWSFEQSASTLTFSGTGDMYDYYWDNLTPWGIYHDQIKRVVVEEGVTNVGAYAFRLFNYPNLTELELASTVKKIKTHAFRDVLGLRNYVFNEGLETIDNYAFGSDNFNMGDVVLPSTLIYMDGNAFRGTTFNSLTVAGENANMKADDLILFSADGKDLIACYRENMTSYIVPDGVKHLIWNAFYKNSTLTSVVLPNTVEDINGSAFAHCSNLKEITLSSALKYMDVWVFENDPLEKVICPAIVPPTIVTGEDATFKGVDLNKCTLIVPVGSKASYEAADGWKDFGTIVEDANISPEPEENEPTDISSYDYVLYFSETEVQSGTTSTLSLNLKNAAEDITAIQCDIYLPEGVEWASTIDNRGNKVLTQPTFNTETERTDETYHTITPVTQMSNGAYRVMCYSMQKEVFLDNDGVVLDIPVTISENMEDGDYSVVIKDIYLTDTKTNQHIVDEVISKLTVFSYTSGDVNADGLINITDIVSVISYILEDAPESFIFKAADVNEDGIINITDIVGIIDIILTDDAPTNATLRRRVAALANALPSLTTLEIVPFGIEQGTTSATVTLDMLNPDDEFTAFECSIKLPEGIGWAYTTDRRGNIIYTQPTFNKAAERTDANYHTLTPVTAMSDGTYKVICYSMQKAEFLDAEGAILDLPLIFAEDLAEGIYEIEVKDIVLTRPNVTDVKPSDYKATVVVGKPAVKSATIYGDITADAIAMLNARLGANESLGSLDLSSAIAVDGTSAITTANPNAVIYVAEEMSVKNESNVVEGDVCANLVLTDGKPFGPAKTFTAKKAEYSRTLSADTYGTIVLPFTPNAETLKGYTFYELTGVETNALTFDEVSNPVAGKPYIVTSDGTATKMSAEAESTVVIEPAAAEADGWTMTGTYESVVFTDADELASLYCISGNQFKQATSKLTMNPFRAYFVGDGSVNSITLRGDDGTTNILNLEGEQAVGQLYDVLGRQVEHAEQGIYIQNGKKVLVK